jgi:hypothetical protein
VVKLSAQSTFQPENAGGVVALAELPADVVEAFVVEALEVDDFAVVDVERAAVA